MQIIFDTGSAWAWLFSENCAAGNCPAKNAKYKQSQSVDFVDNNKAVQKLQYGKGAIAGHPSEDRACFGSDEKHCLDHFKFLTVVKGKDLEALEGSGLIGLAPTPAKRPQMDDSLHNGTPGFVAQLKESYQYSKDFEPVFSFYLSNDVKEQGKMLFGGIDVEQYGKKGLTNQDIFWSPQGSNTAYWTVDSSRITFGTQDKVISDKPAQLILDNGMSFGLAPNRQFVNIVKFLWEDHHIGCKQMQPMWGCLCTKESYNKLPEMSFNFKGLTGTKDMKMPKEAYMMHREKNGQSMCFLLLTPSDFKGIGAKDSKEEYWILGAQFL